MTRIPLPKLYAILVVLLASGVRVAVCDDASQAAAAASLLAIQNEQASFDTSVIFLLQVIAFSIGFLSGSFSFFMILKSWLGKYFI